MLTLEQITNNLNIVINNFFGQQNGANFPTSTTINSKISQDRNNKSATGNSLIENNVLEADAQGYDVRKKVKIDTQSESEDNESSSEEL